MGPLDALWHLFNFFAPAIGIGTLAPALAKLLWRHRLIGVSWRWLSGWATAGATLALIGGLVLFGRDGKVLTYSLMAVCAALGLWWAGFRGRS